METEELMGIEVGFWGKKIIPIRFVWQGRRFEVKRIPMEWERKDGGRRWLCFGVDTGGMMAELAWDMEGRKWLIRGQTAV